MQKKQKGFSLVELMVVAAIISVLSLVAGFNIFAAMPKYNLKAAISDLELNLRKARSIAVKQNRMVKVQFFEQSNRYSIDGKLFPEKESLPAHYGGVSFGFGKAKKDESGKGLPASPVSLGFGRKYITYNQRGVGTGGSVYLANSQGTYKVVINTSGRIRVERLL